MDHTSFTEICLHQLKMSGVRNGERLVVLTQGNDRLAYADAFMAAGQRLGAQMCISACNLGSDSHSVQI